MQKHMLSLFFIVSSFLACAMERESSSFFSSLFVVNQAVLSPMQEVQKGKDNFERQLQISIWSLNRWSSIAAGDFSTAWVFSRQTIEADPVNFFKYCYHNDPYHGPGSLFSFIDMVCFNQQFVSLCNKWKEARIDGYSALGAIIISEEISKKKYPSIKPHLLFRLEICGFTLTEKDKTLVALKLYNVIVEEQKEKILIALLNNKQDSDFSVLPYDIRRCIADYLVCLYKFKTVL